ncbi:limbic system-associated membrane protein-like [Limanda limanda]|uniref:limbic system-associated membrane protein-like n=1 Tax=Limanda limanda TaxID=27771 RepID=UPI0029C739AD|nr:limbic system-associated membrane protein-like [Limanda limanda]
MSSAMQLEKVQTQNPSTEPKLSMSSEVTEGQTITISCTAESFPQSTLTLAKTYPNYKTLKVTENNHHSGPINTLYHTFNVTSADAGWYFCRAQNRDGTKDSKEKELVVKYPPTEPKLYMSSEVTEDQTFTFTCTVESFPESTLTLMRIDPNPQSLEITENKVYSQTSNSLYHKFTVTSADAGLYFCRAKNTEGSKDSKEKELVVKFSPKHTHITELAEKQELDGRSSVMLSCFSHSFPPVQHYSWYRKSQGGEEDETVSEHQNHTVYSNQSGVYYCVAENKLGRRSSDPVHLFEPTDLNILIFIVPALFVLMIIILIIVVLRKKKSIHQGTTNTKSPSGFSEQLRRPEAPGLQPLPDSTPPTDINAVYSILNLPQAASAQNPTRQKAGNTEDYSVHYAPLHFKEKIKKKQRKVEEDSVYAMVCNPTRV